MVITRKKQSTIQGTHEQIQGDFGIGKPIDHLYLNAIGWQAIRARRALLKQMLPQRARGPLALDLIITHIFWSTFMSHADKPSCIEETPYDLYFGDSFYRRLQKLVGNDKGTFRGATA